MNIFRIMLLLSIICVPQIFCMRITLHNAKLLPISVSGPIGGIRCADHQESDLGSPYLLDQQINAIEINFRGSGVSPTSYRGQSSVEGTINDPTNEDTNASGTEWHLSFASDPIAGSAQKQDKKRSATVCLPEITHVHQFKMLTDSLFTPMECPSATDLHWPWDDPLSQAPAQKSSCQTDSAECG